MSFELQGVKENLENVFSFLVAFALDFGVVQNLR
jgi:hypothetical protein